VLQRPDARRRLFAVVDFVPFLLAPEERSRPIVLRFRSQVPTVPASVALVIETNGSDLQIPVHSYSRDLLVSQAGATPSEWSNVVVLRLGRMPSESTYRSSVLIQNTRKHAVEITDLAQTEGVLASLEGDGPNAVLQGFEKRQFNLTIQFASATTQCRSATRAPPPTL
jgi:hypothetical protein